MSVVIETTIGDVTVDLFLKERPKACLNFIKLCKLKYYNFNLFHTIEQGFIAQTGDPTGVGDKGESVWGVIEGPNKKLFEAEMIPKILHSDAGLLSMVAVDNFVGSQFFFTLGTELSSLDGIHCVIGEVVEGHEILRQLNEAIVDNKHRPYKDIRVTHTVILEDPFADPRGFRQPSRSPSPTPERLKNGRIAADEDIDDTQGKTEAEVHEMLQEREAKARATILEIVGDIPDADVAPPENVLFVCKLNPVTTDDDLQIIFSRFGKIKTCEVIRDKTSGDSLQYAFIEFEEQKSCEDAYFKMDNVLIDDRRIHVDFSQSVSKIKWRGKGNYTIHEDSDRFKSEKSSTRKPAIDRRSPRRDFNRNRNDRPRFNDDRPRFNNNDRQRFNEDRPRFNDDRRFNERKVGGNDNRRFNDNRVDNRNFDSRRRSRSPRRNSPPRRSSRSPRRNSPPRRNRLPPARRSRSREIDRKPRDPSPRRNEMSRRRKDNSPLQKSHDKSPPRKRRELSPKLSVKPPKTREQPPKRREPSPKRREPSPKRRDPSPKRREQPLKQREPSPKRQISPSPKRSKKPRISSESSSSSQDDRKKGKSSSKPKKKSSKKSKRRDRSSNSASSDSDSHKKKSRR